MQYIKRTSGTHHYERNQAVQAMIPREIYYFLTCLALMALTVGYVLAVRDAAETPWAIWRKWLARRRATGRE